MNLNFRHIYTRYFLISVVIPILAIFIMFSVIYDNQSKNYRDKVFSGVMSTSVSALDSSFNKIEQISFMPYLFRDVFSMMNYMESGFINPDGEYPDFLNLTQLESNYTMLFTKLLHSSNQKILSITFYPFGQELGNSYSIYRSTAGLQFEQNDAVYVSTLYQYTKPYGSVPVFLVLDDRESNHIPTFTLLRTIKDYDSGKEIGVFRIDVALSSLLPSVNGIKSTNNSRILLTDSQHNPAYASDDVDVALCQAALGKANTMAYNGMKYEFQRQFVGVTGWQLTHIASVNDSRLANFDSILIIFFVTLLAFLSAYFIYRTQSADMVSSIESIMYAIKQLQKGNLSHNCKVKDKKELLLIADALNETGHKIEELIKTEYDARISKSKAEYTALQSQINPHFLYNTLNGFIALNRTGEKKLLEDSIIQLTKLFRYICNDNDITTVEAEYDFATRYLELQKLRFEERISYTVTVAPETATLEIPKLVIQPIVENCIVHGMEEYDKPIEIFLRSFIGSMNDQDCLILEITDNGIGFDTTSAQNAPNVGLKNVIHRLSYFQSQSRYELTSALGKGTTVQLMIPLHKKRAQT
jgi:two-component system sensor histidine kinase YesM